MSTKRGKTDSSKKIRESQGAITLIDVGPHGIHRKLIYREDIPGRLTYLQGEHLFASKLAKLVMKKHQARFRKGPMTRIKRSPKTIKNNRMIKALDADCRARVFERDYGICQRCGTFLDAQWSHVHSRRHYCLRWDDDNSKVLCRPCHFWWSNNPGLAYDWFSKKFPERWERITRVLQSNPRVRVKDLYDELREGGNV